MCVSVASPRGLRRVCLASLASRRVCVCVCDITHLRPNVCVVGLTHAHCQTIQRRGQRHEWSNEHHLRRRCGLWGVQRHGANADGEDSVRVARAHCRHLHACTDVTSRAHRCHLSESHAHTAGQSHAHTAVTCPPTPSSKAPRRRHLQAHTPSPRAPPVAHNARTCSPIPPPRASHCHLLVQAVA